MDLFSEEGITDGEVSVARSGTTDSSVGGGGRGDTVGRQEL